MKALDIFECEYPFVKRMIPPMCGDVDLVFWVGGCDTHYEDGPAVYDGQCIPEIFYECDAIGRIVFEIHG